MSSGCRHLAIRKTDMSIQKIECSSLIKHILRLIDPKGSLDLNAFHSGIFSVVLSPPGLLVRIESAMQLDRKITTPSIESVSVASLADKLSSGRLRFQK